MYILISLLFLLIFDFFGWVLPSLFLFFSALFLGPYFIFYISNKILIVLLRKGFGRWRIFFFFCRGEKKKQTWGIFSALGDSVKLCSLQMNNTFTVLPLGVVVQVSALGLDPSGARLVTGGYDFDIKFWDFAGMDAALQAFRSLQPCEWWERWLIKIFSLIRWIIPWI